MQVTVTVKLNPTAQQFTLLMETVTTCNAACDWINGIAFSEQNFRQYDLHKRCYYVVREQFKLPSCHAVRCISKVADSYKLDRKIQRCFRPLGAIELDKNLLTWRLESQNVSVRTLNTRITLPFLCSVGQKELLKSQKGQADLQIRDGQFYLCVAVTITEPEPFLPSGCIGIDLGLVNVATDSEGNQYTGEPVKKVRQKYRRLRQELQAKKTRSARKRMAKSRQKESRFVRDVNHCISKTLIGIALNRQKALAIEVLTGIRERGNRLKRAMRTELNNWAFAQLKTFLHYKARRAGVTVIEVDSQYSSQQCSQCAHTERANRPSQEVFRCRYCCFQANADVNAAKVLEARATLSTGPRFHLAALAARGGQAVPPSGNGS